MLAIILSKLRLKMQFSYMGALCSYFDMGETQSFRFLPSHMKVFAINIALSFQYRKGVITLKLQIN